MTIVTLPRTPPAATSRLLVGDGVGVHIGHRQRGEVVWVLACEQDRCCVTRATPTRRRVTCGPCREATSA